MINTELSTGRLTSLARLLVFLSKNPHVSAEIACNHLVSTRQIQTEKLANEAKDIALELGLVSQNGVELKLSGAGQSILIGSDDGFGIYLQRRLLLKILTTLRRDLLWIAFATSHELKNKLPQIHQILVELNLIELEHSAKEIQFWDDLKRAEIKFNEAILKKIGDQAESWSIQFEENRLITAGFPLLVKDIHWLSRESDLHGYDILSFSGDIKEPTSRRHIEVKRAKVAKPGYIQFYLSRNEFQQATKIGSSYIFHLWWSGKLSDSFNLTVASSSSILSLTPKNIDESSYWTECLITFDINESEKTFEDCVPKTLL